MRTGRPRTPVGTHVAWSPNLTESRARECGIARVRKEELVSTSHVVTIHMKLADSTRHLVDEEQLRQMRRDAFLVNISRGPLIDEQALVSALEDGALAGAGLDVFSKEPLPAEYPFRRLSNVVATPHIGYVTEESYRIFYGDAVEDIEAFQRGEPIRLAGAASSPAADLNRVFGMG